MKLAPIIITLMCVKYSPAFSLPRAQQSKIGQGEVLAAVSNASAWLAIQLDQKLSKEYPNKNIILSPSCLQMALAMVLLGSRGSTASQIAESLGSHDGRIGGSEVLRFKDEIHEAMSQTFQSNDEKRDRRKSLRIQHSSGIFIQRGYSVQKQYLDDSKRLYKSDVISTDFAGEGYASQETINLWVKNKTLDKIGTILSSPPDPSTEAMILSTLYFKGEWVDRFIELPEREYFTTQDGKKVGVTMLSAKSSYPFLRLENGLSMIGLPYRGGEVLMYVILPDPRNNFKGSFSTLKNSLTPKKVNELITRMELEAVHVKIPKMKLTEGVSLKNSLRALGLKNLFDPNLADLSGMLSSRFMRQQYDSSHLHIPNKEGVPQLYVSDVVHAVEISVDKKGTEAGAATAISIASRAVDVDYYDFHVNRPFIFFIQNKNTKSILFWGSIVDPR